jgi:8-oxo-dGTP diphosphatase
MQQDTQRRACGQLVDVALGILLEPNLPKLGISRRVLITQRRREAVYGGWWEFPGGKIEPGETPEQAVVRELYEEIGVDATPIHRLTCRTHVYEHAAVRLHPLVCVLASGSSRPRAIEVAGCRWLSVDELDRDSFLPANAPVLTELAAYLTSEEPA